MKLNTWTLSLACFAVFALLAVSTPAQNQALQLPSKAYAAKAVSNDRSAAGQTQQKPKSDAVTSDGTGTCTYTFTTGSGTTFLKFCVTVNGNIVEFQSPAGVEQINDGGNPFEGYGICDATNDNTQYFDYAFEGDSENWNAPTTVSHTATEVKIERTTSDGAWTLTQTISLVAGTTPYAKIIMALKNNSATTKSVALLRFANAIPDNRSDVEYYDGSEDSAWGYTPIGSSSTAGKNGLMLQNVGNPAPIAALFGREGFAQNAFNGPAPCNANDQMESPVLNGNGSIVYLYLLSLNKEQTVTVTDRYMSF